MLLAVEEVIADVLFIIAAALFLLDGALRVASNHRERGLVEFGLALIAIGFVVLSRTGEA